MIEELAPELEAPHRFIVDRYEEAGPQGGLLSSFEASDSEYIAVVPCDTPFLTIELFELLFDSSSGFEGAVPKIKGHWEPLIAVYQREPLIELLHDNIQNNRRKLGDIPAKLNVNEIGDDEIFKQGIPKHCFFNINTKDDFLEAQRLIE